MRRHRLPPLLPLLLLCPGLLLFTRCDSAAPPIEDRPQVVVTVNAAAVLREVRPGLILGANLGCWVSNTKLGSRTRELFMDLRPSVARFPGGNLSNNYCWMTQKVSDNNHLQWDDWSWGIDVPQYVAFLKATGCVPRVPRGCESIGRPWLSVTMKGCSDGCAARFRLFRARSTGAPGGPDA